MNDSKQYSKAMTLENGDIILGMLDDEFSFDRNITRISNPVKVVTSKHMVGTSIYEIFVLRPLMVMTDQTYVEIRTSKIMFCVPLTEKHEEEYFKYLHNSSVEYADSDEKLEILAGLPNAFDEDESFPEEDNDDNKPDPKKYH